MLLIGSLLVLLAFASAERTVHHKYGPGWSAAEASRRYFLQKPTPVDYNAKEIDDFLYKLMDKLEDMPQPDDAKYEFVRDENRQLHACEIPEDDDDSMEVSANPDDVMDAVMRSFPDGKCASRRFGEWYYQVCGNLAIKRSPFTVTSRRGKPVVTPFKAFESLGVLGRDRKVSRHAGSVTEPRYVEQTYYGGARCNLGGDERSIQTTVTFECNARFVAGYVHIAEVVEEHPCQYRLQLQSADFCEHDWLRIVVTETSLISCRIYYHPERVAPLLAFLKKFQTSMQEKNRRYDRWTQQPENYARIMRQVQRPDVRERMQDFARDSLQKFERADAEYGMAAERERHQRILDYVLSELTWASLNPDVPFTEEEQRQRAAEEAAGRADDHRRLTNIKNVLEVRRSDFLDDAVDEDEREWYEMQPYTDLLKMADIDPLRDAYLNFYTGWLDYIKTLEMEEWMVVRSWLIPPNRKPASMGTFLLLESLIKSDYADDVRRMLDDIVEVDKEKKEPPVLYDGELDENDLEEIARRFMQVYREAKKGGDTLLFDLLDDEDIDY